MRASLEKPLWLASFFSAAIDYGIQRALKLYEKGYNDIDVYVFRLPRTGVRLIEHLVGTWQEQNYYSGFHAEEIVFLGEVRRFREEGVLYPQKNKRTPKTIWGCYEPLEGTEPEFLRLPFVSDNSSRAYQEGFSRLAKEGWSSLLQFLRQQP